MVPSEERFPLGSTRRGGESVLSVVPTFTPSQKSGIRVKKELQLHPTCPTEPSSSYTNQVRTNVMLSARVRLLSWWGGGNSPLDEKQRITSGSGGCPITFRAPHHENEQRRPIIRWEWSRRHYPTGLEENSRAQRENWTEFRYPRRLESNLKRWVDARWGGSWGSR